MTSVELPTAIAKKSQLQKEKNKTHHNKSKLPLGGCHDAALPRIYMVLSAHIHGIVSLRYDRYAVSFDWAISTQPGHRAALIKLFNPVHMRAHRPWRALAYTIAY
jgi:hypothetical protein